MLVLRELSRTIWAYSTSQAVWQLRAQRHTFFLCSLLARKMADQPALGIYNHHHSFSTLLKKTSLSTHEISQLITNANVPYKGECHRLSNFKTFKNWDNSCAAMTHVAFPDSFRHVPNSEKYALAYSMGLTSWPTWQWVFKQQILKLYHIANYFR